MRHTTNHAAIAYHATVTARRATSLLVLAAVIAVALWAAVPYLTGAAFIARAAQVGGRTEAVADSLAREVTVKPPHTVPTRHGNVPAQFYEPRGTVHRTGVMIPGIHSMGIKEPRLTALAHDMAGAGVRVMTMALPDLTEYRITAAATDVVEDGVAWVAAQPALSPDGKCGIVGISFSGGLSIVAAGRPSIRDHVAFIVSFGGHGDLPRVMRYLATGEAPQVPGVTVHPPHDYGVAVILYGLASGGIVPAEQVKPLRDGIRTFLLASQLTLVNMDEANATFQKAREMAKGLPEPARTDLEYVNDRAVGKLGPLLVPHLDELDSNAPALSPQRVDSAPAAPVFLLHGAEDTVIPPVESVLLADTLRMRGVRVRLLLSALITHAEVDRSAAAAEMWKLIAFWSDALRR
jgi:dienelactone hydrolase